MNDKYEYYELEEMGEVGNRIREERNIKDTDSEQTKRNKVKSENKQV